MHCVEVEIGHQQQAELLSGNLMDWDHAQLSPASSSRFQHP